MYRAILGAAGALALLIVPSAALAHGRDRNGDRIPDRWEHRHHLSLRVDQALGDPDDDGLDNRREHRFHTDPLAADSDDDGVVDGEEHGAGPAATVASFTGGVLVLSLPDGSTVRGLVTADTEIGCASAADERSDGGDDDQGEDQGEDQGDDHGGQRGDDDQGEDDQSDDRGDDDVACAPASLVAGATVRSAELELEHGQAVFEEIDLG